MTKYLVKTVLFTLTGATFTTYYGRSDERIKWDGLTAKNVKRIGYCTEASARKSYRFNEAKNGANYVLKAYIVPFDV